MLAHVKMPGKVAMQWATDLEVFCTANYRVNMKDLRKEKAQDAHEAKEGTTLSILCNEKEVEGGKKKGHGIGDGNHWDWGDEVVPTGFRYPRDKTENQGATIFVRPTDMNECDYSMPPFSCEAKTQWPESADMKVC